MSLIPKESLPLFKRGEDVGSEQLEQMQDVIRTSINILYERLESIRHLAVTEGSDVQGYRIINDVKTVTQKVQTLTNTVGAMIEDVLEQVDQLSTMVVGFNDQIAALDANKAKRSDLTLMLKDLQECKDYANFIRTEYAEGRLTGATYTPSITPQGDLSFTNDKGKPNPATVNVRGATFTPSIDSSGILTFTNDKGLTNPNPVNVKGGIFIPSVTAAGMLTFTNDKGLPNPDPVNIKGPAGFAPVVTVKESTPSSYKLEINTGSGTVITPNLKGQDGSGSGDMLMQIYDTNGNGIVDNAEKVGGKGLSDLALKATRISGSITTAWNGTSAPWTQNITVPGVTSTTIVEVSLASTATAQQEEQWDLLRPKDGGQSTNQITLKTSSVKNTVALPINIIVRGD